MGDWVTVDWDEELVPEEVRERIRYLAHRFALGEVFGYYGTNTVRISYRRSSNHGWHLKIEFPYTVLSAVERLKVRGMFEDDPHRLEFDLERSKHGAATDYSRGVLYDEKRYPDGTKKKAGPWQRYADDSGGL